MKRKIFSKLLMGAFLIASISSFVSCKDYDDDIKSINDKLATVALQTTVDNLQSQLQSAAAAAAAAQKTADQAVAAAAAAQATANDAATKAALATVEATAKAAGEEAAKAIANAATAQTAAEAAQKTADQAAEAAKAAQEAADKAAAAAAAGTDAAKADAAAAAAAAAAAQKVAEEAAAAAAKAASDNKSATDAAAEVAKAAKAAADDVTAKIATLSTQIATAQSTAEAAQKAAEAAQKAADLAAGKEVDLSNYVTKADLATALKDYAKATNDYVTNDKLNEALTPIKEQLAKVNNELEKLEVLGDLVAFKQKVDNYEASIKQLFTAITSISLYRSIISYKVDLDGDGNPDNLNNNDFDQILLYDRINKYDPHFTTVKLNAGGTTGASTQDGTFGKKDYYGANAAFNAAANTSRIFNHADWIDDANELIVRVSPANADLSVASLKFMDTKGEDLNGIVEVVGVAPYKDNNAATRAGSVTGLWSVYIKLKDGVTDGTLFGKTYRAGNTKVYALAANNTTDKSADRFVVSEYDVTFSGTRTIVTNHTMDNGYLTIDYTAATTKNLVAIKGRTNVTAGGKGYNDYEWADNGYPTTGTNTTQPATNRTALTAYAVNNGQTFTVVSDAWWSAKYMYVIRDDKNANLDNDASEINAWNSYSYTGINTLVEGSSAQISVTIPKTQLMGDEVAFRAFAVGHDGNLLDPDGYPFTVFVGNEVRSSTVSGSFHATKARSLVKVFPVTTAIATGQGFVATMLAPIQLKIGNTVVNAPTKIVWKKNADGSSNATKWSEAKYVEITFDNTRDMCRWEDGKTATATLAFQSGTPATEDWYVNFSLTKELPTADDVKELWSWKSGQLNGNIWTAVMYPETAADAADASVTAPWNASTDAYKGMNNAINGLVNAAGTAYINPDDKYQVDGLNFFFDFANSAEDNKTYSATKRVVKAPAGPVVHGTYSDGFILNLADATNEKLKKLIDNKTQHASTINFDFGLVSSACFTQPNPLAPGWFYNYSVKLQDFQTIYACPFDELTFTISPYKDGVKLNTVGNKVAVGDQAWNYVYYNDAQIGKGVYDNAASNATFTAAAMQNEIATNVNFLKVSSKLGAEMVVPTLADLCGHLKTRECKFFSNDTQNEDYFTAAVTNTGVITLTRISGTQDPRKDIPSTLRITGKCAYDHSHTFDIPFTVKTTAE